METVVRHIDRVEKKLMSELTAMEKLYVRKIEEFLRKYYATGRALTVTGQDLEALAAIKKELTKIFLENKVYQSAVSEYLFSFNQLQNLTLSTLSVPSGLAPLVLSGQRAAVADLVVSNLANKAAVDMAFVQPIQRILYNAVTFGSSIGEVEETIRGLVLTTPDKNGMLTRYAGQIATDAMTQFQGAIYQKAVDAYDMPIFRYTGSLIDTSRQFCKDMVNGTGKLERFKQKDGTFKIEDLPEIIKIGETMPGWIAGTTPETFFINRGGWRCRHQAIPGFPETKRTRRFVNPTAMAA